MKNCFFIKLTYFLFLFCLVKTGWTSEPADSQQFEIYPLAKDNFASAGLPPEWVTLPDALNLTLQCDDAAGFNAAQAMKPVAKSSCELAGLTLTKTSGPFVPSSCTYNGSYTNTWVATDNCGNSSTIYKQVITIVNNTVPVISPLPEPSVIQCSQTPVFKYPTVTVGCDLNLTLSYTDVVAPGACPSSYSITRTWTAKDACGNVSLPVSQTISLKDDKAPVFSTSAGSLDRQLSCSDIEGLKNALLLIPEATDNCSSNLSIHLLSDVTTPVAGKANDYVRTRKWNFDDGCGNVSTEFVQVISVSDTEKPLITAPQEVNITTDAGKCTASGVSLGTPVASDNCSVASVTNDAVQPFAQGTTKVTWTVTDGSGNTSNAVQLVNVSDTEKPLITAPPAVNVSSDAGKCTATKVQLGTPVTSDNCTIASVTNNAAEPFALGSTTVTWTVTDKAGNTSTAVQVVTVTDAEKPSVTAPPAVNVNTDAGKCTASGVSLGTPVVSDNCTVASVSNNAVEPFLQGVTTVTWTVTDAAGNTNTATQVVTVADSEKPLVTSPSLIQINTDAGKCTASGVFLGVPVTSDNCSVASVTNNAVEPFAQGNTTVIWTVTDKAGNTSTATQIVTVSDVEKPSITAPAALNIGTDAGKCTASGVSLGAPVTSDNCSVASVNSNAVEPFAPGSTTVTWTVTDKAGNTSTATQIVTVTDSEKPSITPPPAINVNTDPGKCFATGVLLGVPVTSDNCTVASVTNNAVEPFPQGSTTVTWTVTDKAGNSSTANQVVTVTDTERPAITPPAALTIHTDAGKCTASGVSLGTPVASDNCSVASITNNAAEPFAQGSTTITWTVTDKAGNTSTATQIITVIDSEKPSITAPPPVNVSTDPGKCTVSGVSLGTPVTSDNCAVASVVNNAVEPFAQGSTSVIWTVTDKAGNTNTATQIVTVTDSEKPSITAPANINVVQNAGECGVTGLNLGVPLTSDNCSVTSITNNAPQSFPPGQTVVTWRVADASGNTSTGSQTIMVIDNQPPSIIAPAAVFVSTDPGKNIATGVNLGLPVTSDSCPVQVSNNAAEPFPLGETTVTWKVTDTFGNTTTATQVVTVSDNEKPTFTECRNETANTDLGLKAYLYKGGNWNSIASDNDRVSLLVYNLSGATTGSGNTFNNIKLNIGVTSIILMATDNSGNTNTCIFEVTVTDKEKPLFSNCPVQEVKLKTGVGNTTYTIIGNAFDVTATDNDQLQSLSYILSGVTTGTGTSLDRVILNIGETTVTWTAADVSGNVSACTYKIIVLDSNLPPLAVEDHFTVKEGTELLESVRSNDSDLTVSNEMLMVDLVESTLHGKLVIHEDGSFSYFPDKDFIGEDYFTYRLCKIDYPNLCSQARVTITVEKNADCEVIIPDSFSPNGDGINDNFRIKCIYNYPEAVLKVYTRSGIKIFEKKNYGNIDFWGSENDAFWDGRSDNKWNVGGTKLAAATYIYILELEPGKKEKVLTGSVFLNY